MTIIFLKAVSFFIHSNPKQNVLSGPSWIYPIWMRSDRNGSRSLELLNFEYRKINRRLRGWSERLHCLRIHASDASTLEGDGQLQKPHPEPSHKSVGHGIPGNCTTPPLFEGQRALYSFSFCSPALSIIGKARATVS
jgi:hypothetical protein